MTFLENFLLLQLFFELTIPKKYTNLDPNDYTSEVPYEHAIGDLSTVYALMLLNMITKQHRSPLEGSLVNKV